MDNFTKNSSIEADYIWEDTIIQPSETSVISESLTASELNIPLIGRMIQRVILPIICSMGIIGIILTLIVLSRKTMHTSTNCYLMALATTDLLFLLILATHLTDNQFEPFSQHYHHFVIYVTYSAIFMQIFLFASVWLTVALAVERFIGICKPFLATAFCTVQKAGLAIVAVYVMAVLCRSPNFWEIKVKTINHSSMNRSLTYIEGSALSTDRNYIVLYPWMIDGVLTSILPFMILVYLNGRLVWEVRKSTKYLQRNQMLAGSDASSVIQREELQVTIMLISVIIVFFICQAPYVLYTAVMSINKFALSSQCVRVFRYIAILMLGLKSSVNFVLYCWFSEKFVLTFRRIFEIRLMFKTGNDGRHNSVTSRLSVYTSARDTVV